MRAVQRKLKEIELQIEKGFYYETHFNVYVSDEEPNFHCDYKTFNTLDEVIIYISNHPAKHPTKEINVLIDDMECSEKTRKKVFKK